MRLFGWFRRAPQQAEPPASTPRRWAWLGGRRVLTNTPYILPKDKAEGDRLDLQHHLLKVVVGKNYRAPIRQPRAILDVACGTGIWAREMAQQFKRAQVIGFDIDRTPLEAALARLGPSGQFPANFKFMEADALQRFPFEDEQFDFTHARFISPFVPIARWPHVVAEMVRVTKRGGYVELVDLEQFLPLTKSQACLTLMSAVEGLAVSRGMDTHVGDKLGHFLRQAGATHIQERRFIIGAGRESLRQQRLLASDLLAVVKNMSPILIQAGYFTNERYNELYQQAEIEVSQMGINGQVRIASAQKL
jgi:ubiquinone/menaquinone biosynthesis C-methylase UbiE